MNLKKTKIAATALTTSRNQLSAQHLENRNMIRNARSLTLAAAVLAAVIVGANSASAAVITWSNVTSATDASLSTAGTLLEAANFGGSTVDVNGVTFTGVSFPASLSNLTGTAIWSSNGSYLPAPGLGDIDDIFTTIGSISTLSPLSITGLSVGQEYELQVFVFATGGVASRTYTLSDGGAPANEITVTYGDANLVTGTFTADGTTQSMTWTESVGSNIASGYQLRVVPEPASLAMALMGLTLLAVRRHR